MDISANEVCEDIISLLDLVKHKMLEMAEYEGLTRMQIFGLYILDSHPDIGMTHMAEVLHCDASNVTGIVDRLVQHGLVNRVEDQNDRRIKKLSVTKKGKQTITKILSTLPELIGCNKLSPKERQSLHSIIEKLRD